MDNLPTLRGWLRSGKRGLPLAIIAAIDLAALSAMAMVHLFLRRFDGSWPEMLCYPTTNAMFQIVVAGQLGFLFAALALGETSRSVQFRIGVPTATVAIVQAGAVGRTMWELSRWQYDVGCGVARDWSPNRIIVQTLMSHIGGAVVLLLCLVFGFLSVRSVSRGAAT